MIEDKSLGLMMAEDEVEAAWYNTAEETKQMIKSLQKRISDAKKDIKLSDRKIGQKFREGARSSIKVNETAIKLQKEFLKLAESKIIRKQKV